jgi:hypothetical protein
VTASYEAPREGVWAPRLSTKEIYKPYVICHMVSSVDGRIPAEMR